VRAVWEQALAGFFAGRSKLEIAEDGRRRGINACVVAEPADVLSDPHLAAREFWADADGLREPGRFTAIREGGAAPVRAFAASDRGGPLAGVRVLDFSWALVGSITTKTLGDLGAEVIKVESATRPCLSRIDVQVSASSSGNLDDKPWFAHLNSSKQSLALDMKHPRALEVLDPLIEWADVVVENFSPGTMAKLGLDYDQLARRNPRIVMVSGSVYGQSGPLAREWGVDGTGAALSGRTYLTGWPDRDPVIPGAVPYGDVIVPFVMAAVTAAALQHRRGTGRGGHIDASMYEICVQQMRAALIAEQQGRRPARTGNDDPLWHRQAVWPAAGADRWIAVSIRDEAQWRRLCELAGGTDIAAWTTARDGHELMQLLQAQGIAAGVVQDIEDLMERDPGLQARHPLVVLPHPHLGEFGHVRTPLDLTLTPQAPYRAPGLGEHSTRVAARICGLSPDTIAELAAAGVFR